MPGLPKIIKAEIKINNALLTNFNEGAKLFLLKRAGHTKRLEVVAEVTNGWLAIFDKEFRDDLKVSIATLADISDYTAQSSFLAYGVGGVSDNLDVFSFENKDVIKPNALSPSWEIFATRAPTESFVVPIGSPPLPIVD